jgi:WD40 repeat protein
MFLPPLQTCVVAVAAFPDGRWVASGMESTIRIWDTRNATTQCILKIDSDEYVEAVDVSPAGGYFASGDTGGMTIWKQKSVVRSQS